MRRTTEPRKSPAGRQPPPPTLWTPSVSIDLSNAVTDNRPGLVEAVHNLVARASPEHSPNCACYPTPREIVLVPLRRNPE
jgi:hypothetical protein